MDRFDDLIAAIAREVGTKQLGAHTAVSLATDLVSRHRRRLCPRDDETIRPAAAAAVAILDAIASSTFAAQHTYQAGRMFGFDHVAAVSNARAGLSALLFDVLGDQFECRLSAGWDQHIHQDKVTAEASFLDILDEKGQGQT
jgi:hypothetical protein